MKVTRILVLVVALGAGLLAAVLMRGMVGQEQPTEAAAPVKMARMEEVLVARADINLGTRISSDQLGWQSWPETALNDRYIRKSQRPNAISKLTGAIAGAPFINGEPVNEGKLINSDRGFMSAILPKGMRAVAVEVRAANTAGGFILPNDRVDVLLTQKTDKPGRSGEAYSSRTIIENVRVLAIDQKLKEDKGAKSVVAKDTATLELTPRQSETIVRSAQLGTISLALRSIADSKPGETSEMDKQPARRGDVNVVKFGVSSKVTTGR